MRTASLLLLTLITACGSSTDVAHARYNFAVIDGLDQHSTAGAATLAKPVTSQVTRDPQGKFATRVFDFFAPAIAYAQSLSLPGDPVPDQIVCGEETGVGEPKVVPLCAFTLADGKAANSVQGGTKAGVYTIRFTAQLATEMPVKDSTTITVEAGPMATTVFTPGHGFGCWTVFPSVNVLDQYGNAVPYRFVSKGTLAHVASDVIGTAGARTFVADAQSQTIAPVPPETASHLEYQAVTVEVASGVIATGKLTVPNLSKGCVDLDF